MYVRSKQVPRSISGLFLGFALLSLSASTGKDPFREKSWHLDAIGAPEAWKTTLGNYRATIAIVDSGLKVEEPDLEGQLWTNPAEIEDGIDNDGNGLIDDLHGWDYVQSKPKIVDKSGHGTFIGGIAAARMGNAIGGVGVCPECYVLPLRFLNYEGLGDTEDAIDAIYYAAKKGVQVFNLSFSGDGFDKDLKDAMDFAGAHDMVVVVAASNDGENLDKENTYPAKFNLPHQITVAAHDSDNELWGWSNWGKKTVHLAAPGEDIYGPDLSGGWDVGEGTSFAAGVMSGAVGLLRAAYPALSAIQVKAIFLATAKPSEALKGKVASGGVLNLAAAMKCASQKGLPCLAPPK